MALAVGLGSASSGPLRIETVGQRSFNGGVELFGERQRREERDRAEAKGADFWTATLDESVRYKLMYAVRDATRNEGEVYENIRDWSVRSLGKPSLVGISSSSSRDVLEAVLNADERVVFSILEACAVSVGIRRRGTYDSEEWSRSYEAYGNAVRSILREHRIKFDLVGFQIIPKESEELHSEVVAPVLRLLSGRSGWESVEKAYQDALAELHNGKAEDAITDAAVALEEALALHGCKGNTLSKKMSDARGRGVFAPQDSLLADAIDRVGRWVEAERSDSGDAHNASSASFEDGWLVVHIVGALIRRLVEGPRA